MCSQGMFADEAACHVNNLWGFVFVKSFPNKSAHIKMDDCFQIVREGPLFHSFLFWAGRVAIGRYKKSPFLRASSMKSRLFTGQFLRHCMVPACAVPRTMLVREPDGPPSNQKQTSVV